MIKHLLKSLRVRIILFFILLILLPFLYLTDYNFARAETVLRQQSIVLLQANLEQMGKNIETICHDCIRLSNILITDNIILDNLTSENSGYSGKDLFHLSTQDFLRTSTIENRFYYVKSNFFYNYSTDVILLAADGMVYCSNDISDHFKTKQYFNDKYSDPNWFSGLFSKDMELFWNTSPEDTASVGIQDTSDGLISVNRVIRDEYTKRPVGLVVINLSMSYLRELMRDYSDSSILLLNEKKEIICQSGNTQLPVDASLLGNGTMLDVEGKEYIVNRYSLNKFGWELVSFTDYQILMSEVTELKNRTFTASLTALAAILTVSILVMMYMTNPLKHLMARIRKIDIGGYDLSSVSIEIEDTIIRSDVSDLVLSVEFLAEQTEGLVGKVIDEQRIQANLKYEALRAQINPHFLFNTLNTIRWSAAINGDNSTVKMITELGKLMEVSMNKGTEEISLRKELELVDAYVYIQNIRYNNIISLRINAQEEHKGYGIIKLLLQPIVENAIIHGLKYKKGDITLNVSVENGILVIDVSDSGDGFPDGYYIGSDELIPFSGIGLKNVQERIQLRYGNEYGLSVIEGDSCTTIRLRLPALVQTEDDVKAQVDS